MTDKNNGVLVFVEVAESQPVVGKFDTGQSHRYVGYEVTNRFDESSMERCEYMSIR